MVETLDLSYSNVCELNELIDTKLPGRPPFRCREVIVDGHAFDVYFCDIIQCIRSLFADPQFAQHLKTAPERHYVDANQTLRAYNEMNTGKWWWKLQVSFLFLSDSTSFA